MLRIAGPDEVAHDTAVELSRVLHPSSGLPGRVVLALVTSPPVAPDRPRPGAGGGPGAAIVRIEDHPRYSPVR